MRRYRKSYFRSFANGVLLAGLPVAAFFGADYLLAPPAPGSTATLSSSADGTSAVEIVSRQIAASATTRTGASQLSGTQAQHPVGATSAEAGVRQVAAQGGTAPGQGKTGLVAAIQQELSRVGCYAGEPDGTWNDRTRVAMQAFNSSVHVSLPTGNPDYILLTLLQGHSAKACTRSCETDAARPGSCVDKSIEARTIAPPAASTPNQTTASSVAPTAWTSTVVVATPGKVTTEMLAPAAAAAPKAAVAVAPKAPAADVRPVGEQPRPDMAAVALPAVGAAAASADMDGRMAIGVLPPPRTQAVVKTRTVADTPRPQRVQAQASAPARSPRSTFSDLARSAP